MMIKVLIGDIFESKVKTIVNTVNCVGVMGKGIALEFKKRFPDMMKDYKAKCNQKHVKPGRPYFYHNLFGQSIVNFPTKNHWRAASRLEDVINGLDFFVDNYKSWGIESIAFPPLGCGNGGLDWEVVGRVMYQKLAHLDIDVEMYAPYGTKKTKLSHEYLSKDIAIDLHTKGHKNSKLKKEWVALLEVIHRLANEAYAAPIGRVIFQKICYVMTEQKIDTGFKFKQGDYGPFSEDVKNVISIFANANLASEAQLGQMTQLKIGSQYDKIKPKYQTYLSSIENKISKTVDLFSRIKNTKQAEEVVTVFYAIRQLKQKHKNVSETDVLDYVIDWKRSWDTANKKTAIASAIRHLLISRWIDVEYSESLIGDELLI
jgi:O-acetyl-ADP-ribose deacetylase (regulator of RNase III)/uncharacterized protein YwgA